MRRNLIFIVVIACLAGSTIDMRAGTLAGVTMPESIQAGGTTLVLNGMGVRRKFMVKVYVAGLYLQKKSSDPTAILMVDTPKRMVMHFVHAASKSQMTDAFEESFANNTPDAIKAMKTEINQLLGALEPVKDGDEMVFTYAPGMGTTLAINGAEKLTIAAPNFGGVLFSVWLGPKPPNTDLKKGLLGQ